MDDLGKEYWSLANAITAFAAAQSLALAYALAGDTGDKIRTEKVGVAIAIVLAVIAFCAAVWYCNDVHTTLATFDDAHRGVLSNTMLGRMAAIVIYGGFGLYLLLTTGTPGGLTKQTPK